MESEINSMTTDQIDNLKCQKEKELQEALEAMTIVEERDSEISKQIIELRKQKEDIKIALSKGRNNIRVIQSEIRVLNSAYWKKRQ